MVTERLRGTVDKLKGAVKTAAGKVTGSKKLQAEGEADKVKGAAHSAAAKVKDAARKVAK